MNYNSSKLSGIVDDYANIRTLPAFISAVFISLSLYQFGGIDPIAFNWGINYTFQPGHAILGSLAAYAIAFASSETKSFEYYEVWEKALIAAGPLAVAGWGYIPAIENLLLQLGDPMGAQVGFLLSVVSWIVMVR